MADQKQTVKFGDICREVKLTCKDPLAEGYDKYIGLEHLDSGSLKIKRWGSIAEDKPSFTRVFKKGHILFGKRRSYLKKAGIAEFDGICSSGIVVMEPKGNLMLPELLPFLVQSDKFWDWAIKTSSGSLSPRTKFKSISENHFVIKKDTREQVFTLKILSKLEEILDSNFSHRLQLQKIKELLEKNLLFGSFDCSVKHDDQFVRLSDLGVLKNGLNKDKDSFGFGHPFINLDDVFGVDKISESPAGLVEVSENELENYSVKRGDILILLPLM